MTATKTIDLLAIAERCEQASSDYQATMLKEAAYAILGDEADNRDNPGFWPKAVDFTAKLRAQAYLDAALTLVPEGYCISAMGEIPDDLCWYVEIWKDGADYHQGEVRGKSAALALCAAALRAMEASNGDNP